MTYPKVISAGFFGFIYQHLVPIARNLGYALTLHGSMQRDLDLVAIPWTLQAADPYDLVSAIRDATCGHIVDEWDFHKCGESGDFSKRNPTIKPHNRLAWAIQLGGGVYIDLSVLPRKGDDYGEKV